VSEVLLLGGSGVLGRSLLTHLRGRDVVATARSPEKLDRVRELGARGVVCDVFDRAALTELAVETQPEIVVNFVTDLAAKDFTANSRVRREAGPNVVAASQAAGARRLVVESISFSSPGDDATAMLERSALESGLDAVVLRFGLFWGPGTWYEVEPKDDLPHVHIEEAGRRAAELLFAAAVGIQLI
jgi:nucleoside-diphosphate-sugar epimerase